MCLELGTVRQVNGLGRNVVDRRLTVVAQRRQILSLAEQPIPRASATPARSASAPDRRASRTWCGYQTKPAPDRPSLTEDWPGPAGLAAAGLPPRPSGRAARAERSAPHAIVRPTGFRCARTPHRNSNAAGGTPGVIKGQRTAHRARAEALVERGSAADIRGCGIDPAGQVEIGHPDGQSQRHGERRCAECRFAEQSGTAARSKPGCAGRLSIHPSPARRFGITSDS